MRRHLCNQDGAALVLALAAVSVLTLAAATTIAFSTANSRTSSVDQSRQEAFALAEAGLTHALSVLANSPDARTAANFASTTPIAMEGGTYSYSATRSGRVWTLQGIGTLPNPSGGAPLDKEIFRTVVVEGLAAAGIPPEWNRLFAGRPDTCMKIKKVTIEGPIELRGGLCAEDTAKINSDWVQISGNVVLKGSTTSIGLSGDPVENVAISGTCTWDKSKTGGTACNSGNAIYADNFSSTPSIAGQPSVDWSYWFQNAMPGPSYPCTVGSWPNAAPMGLDDELDGDSPKFNMTPKDSSYSCKVLDSAGFVLGEISWNHLTHVLKVKGVIYYDGDVVTTDSSITNYQGKATIYISGGWHNHEIFCAGGDGTRDCRTDMSNWDPTTNMLWIIAGAAEEKVGHLDLKFHKKSSAFQGGLYGKNKCDVGGMTSGPVVCNELKLGKDDDEDLAQHAAWPPLNGESSGQVIPLNGDYTLILGPQYG